MLYISKPVFYLVLVLIALLPVSKKAGLLLHGERTTGTVIKRGEIDSRHSEYAKMINVSFIRFSPNGKTYLIASPENVIYDTGTTLTVLYDKENPAHNTLYTFSAIYSGYGLVLAGFVMMFWMAFYLTFASKKPAGKKGFIKKGYNFNRPRLGE